MATDQPNASPSLEMVFNEWVGATPNAKINQAAIEDGLKLGILLVYAATGESYFSSCTDGTLTLVKERDLEVAPPVVETSLELLTKNILHSPRSARLFGIIVPGIKEEAFRQTVLLHSLVHLDATEIRSMVLDRMPPNEMLRLLRRFNQIFTPAEKVTSTGVVFNGLRAVLRREPSPHSQVMKLSQPTPTTPVTSTDSSLLKTFEVAAMFNITERTVINWVNSGKIKFITVGRHSTRRYRFEPQEVLRLLEQHSLANPAD